MGCVLSCLCKPNRARMLIHYFACESAVPACIVRYSWCHVQPPSFTCHKVCYSAVQIRRLWFVLAEPAPELLWGDPCVDVHHRLCWHAWRASRQSLDNCQPSVHIVFADVCIRCACFDEPCSKKGQTIMRGKLKPSPNLPLMAVL